MAASPVTPQVGSAVSVPVGGTAVNAFPGGISGGFLQNPVAATDQGLSNAENLYVDPTGNPATQQGNGSTFALAPGVTWSVIPGQTTATSVNAPSSGHKFSAVYWP